MEEGDKVRLDEIYRLTQDNNRMLHAMRRSAFMGGFLKFVMYAAIIAASVWSYYVYLNPLLNTLLKQMADLQNMNNQAQEQLGTLQKGAEGQVGNLNDVLTKLQSQLKSAQSR